MTKCKEEKVVTGIIKKMGARLRIFLNQEEDRTWHELRGAMTVPQRVKDRAEAVRLNSQGWSVEKIASHLKCNIVTIRQSLHRWRDRGLGGLWDQKHQGRQRRWNEADIKYIEDKLRNDQRTYNSKQLSLKLSEERGVTLSPGRLRQILKKKDLKWKRVRLSHHGKQDPQKRAIKQADLDMLELAAACGEIDLYYWDESGLCLWSNGGYSYYFQGEQAKQASHILSITGRIRVIVQDNGSSHRSAKVQQQWSEWEKQGLYLFFLPEYCSEMNPIELEWQHLKKDEIAGQMFEDELDLAYAVIAGVQARGQRNGHNTHRFKFPSTYASQSVT